MKPSIGQLQTRLDSNDATERRVSLNKLLNALETGERILPKESQETNVHYHTFFSYNACGYSPSRIAWEARNLGLAVAGIVDFDVFDGLEEFYDASEKLGLKGSVGMETRVFVPEFADKVINSPGEPGISYHMGTGFPSLAALEDQQAYCDKLRQTVIERNKGLLSRVNRYLDAISLDYENEVLPLTPANNATERHVCVAYAKKARAVFLNDKDLCHYWADKLGTEFSPDSLPESKDLLNTIRAKTMKKGGVGYVQPDTGSFPTMEEVNSFILATGGIPTLTWLDGTSDGEQEMERLLDVSMGTGVAAVNIIPNRNYTPGLGTSDIKCQNLYAFVKLAESRDLPIIVGTEMNSPGQKMVDDFQTDELIPLTGIFLRGAYVIYAHSAMQRHCGLGYTSQWARKHFDSIKAKNTFFEALGQSLAPRDQRILAQYGPTSDPQDIIRQIKA